MNIFVAPNQYDLKFKSLGKQITVPLPWLETIQAGVCASLLMFASDMHPDR